MAWQLETVNNRNEKNSGGWVLEDQPSPSRLPTYDTKGKEWLSTLANSTSDVLKGYGKMAMRPGSIPGAAAESGLNILSETPSFLLGITAAIQEGAKSILSGNSMEDIYSHISEAYHGMKSDAEKILPPYQPKYDPEGAALVTQTALSPALLTKDITTRIAKSKDMKGHPSLQAATNLAGDILSLVVQGKAHGAMKVGKTGPDGSPIPSAETFESTPGMKDPTTPGQALSRLHMERASVPGRPLSHLANLERSIRADKLPPNERTVGVPSAEEAASTFESQSYPPDAVNKLGDRLNAIRESINLPAEDVSKTKSAPLMDVEEARSRALETRAAERPEYQSMVERNQRDWVLEQQAKQVGEKVGPREPGGSQTELPKARSEAIKGMEKEDKVRPISEILSDLNDVLGKRGSTSGLRTPEQRAAHARLSRDIKVIRRNAARTGKEVGQYLLDLGTDPAVVDAIVGTQKSIIAGTPIVTPQEVAKQHNVTFNKMWEFPPEMNKEPIYNWTDNLTHGDFTSDSLLDVGQKLAEHHKRFGVKSGVPSQTPRSVPPPLDSNTNLADLVADAEAQLAASKVTGSYGEAASTPGDAFSLPPIESVVSGMETTNQAKGFIYKLTRTKEGVSEALNSPEVVYNRDKSGVGAKIYQTLDRADQKGNAFLYEQGKEFDVASKGIKEGKESDLRVGAALDGKLERKSLSLPERRLYDNLRTKFDYLIKRYAQGAASSDKMYSEIVRYSNRKTGPPAGWVDGLGKQDRAVWDLMQRRVSDYLPHIFDRESLMAEFVSEAARIRAKLQTAVGGASTFHRNRLRQLEDSINTMNGGGLVTYQALPVNIRMRFFEPRKGKEGYSLSAIKAYRTYLNGIKRKIFDEPAVRQVADLHKSLDPSLKEYNRWYVRRYLGWDRNKLDDIAGAISSFQWMRTLGLNPRSAVVNLTQRVNTVAEAGISASLKAQKEAFTKEGNAAFDATGIAREIPQVLMEGTAPAGMENVRAILGYLFNKVEIGNRKHAFLAGRGKALAEGKSMGDATQAGIDMVHKTQFRYGRVGMPKVLSHPVGRVGLQFWSFPIKQLELVTDWAKHNPKKLLAYIAMAEGGKKTLQELLNVDLSNALGFGMNLGQAIEALKDLPDQDWRGFVRHMKVAASEGGGVLPSGLGPTISSLMNVMEKAKEGRGMDTLRKELSPVLVNRVTQAYKAVINKNDKNLYPIYNQDKQLMYYLTGKQLLMRSIGPRSYTESQQYTNFRADQLLDQERQQILRDVTRSIVDGDNKKANTLITKYGIVPSEESIAAEVLRRELPQETRRVINRTNKQWEFRATQGEDQGDNQ